MAFMYVNRYKHEKGTAMIVLLEFSLVFRLLFCTGCYINILQKYVKIIEDIMVPPFFLHSFLPMLELMIAFPCLFPLLGVLVSNSYWVCPFHLILRRERSLVKKTASEPLGHPCLCPPSHHSRVSHFLLWGSTPTSLESSVCLFVPPHPTPVCVSVCVYVLECTIEIRRWHWFLGLAWDLVWHTFSCWLSLCIRANWFTNL